MRKREACGPMKKEESAMYKYRASTGGHAPEFLRDAFSKYLDENTSPLIKLGDICEIDDETKKPISWLIGKLWNCTDILPGERVSWFENFGGLPGAHTYGAAARALKEIIRVYKTDPKIVAFALVRD
jgi:hypothetical protein